MTESIRVAVYCRLAQMDDNRMEAQTEQIINHALKQGYTNLSLYIDNGASGAVLDRPAFSQMNDDIAVGLIDVVLTLSFDRIGRDYITAKRWVDGINSMGIGFETIDDSYDGFGMMLHETMWWLAADEYYAGNRLRADEFNTWDKALAGKSDAWDKPWAGEFNVRNKPRTVGLNVWNKLKTDRADESNAYNKPKADRTDESDARNRPQADRKDESDVRNMPQADKKDESDARNKPQADRTVVSNARNMPQADRKDESNVRNKPRLITADPQLSCEGGM